MRRLYWDRTEAGEALAGEVERVVTGPSVVAAIPRGGAVVAAPIAQRLGSPLTLVYVRKITLEAVPELAVGALDEDGRALMEPNAVDAVGGTPKEVAEARARVLAEIERQRLLYRALPLSQLARGRTAVLVDDGVATGLTLAAAVAFARRHGAARVVVAAPCSSTHAAELMERSADTFVCPWIDPTFLSVGGYYQDFSPVTDDEVLTALASGVTAREA